MLLYTQTHVKTKTQLYQLLGPSNPNVKIITVSCINHDIKLGWEPSLHHQLLCNAIQHH